MTLVVTVDNPDPGDITLPKTVTIHDSPVAVMADYPDMQKPRDGSWLLDVQLSTDSSCPVTVKVELLQDQRQISRGYVLIADHVFTISNVPTDYYLPIDDVSMVVMGRCHVSKLKVRITPTELCPSSSSSSSSTSSDSSSSHQSSSSSTSSVSSSSTSSTSSSSGSGTSSSSSGSGCCATPLPATLYATIANLSDCACASGTITLTGSGSTRTGSGALGSCDNTISLIFDCETISGVDYYVLDVTHSNDTYNCYSPHTRFPQRATCNPVYAQFMIGPSGDHPPQVGCCGTPGVANAYTVTVTE